MLSEDPENPADYFYSAATPRSRGVLWPIFTPALIGRALELPDIQIPEICPVLGIRLERGNRGGCAASASLDRIVPELGYTKGNVHVISLRANRLKSDATPAELRLVADFFEQLDSEGIDSITKTAKASGLKAFLSACVGRHSG